MTAPHPQHSSHQTHHIRRRNPYPSGTFYAASWEFQQACRALWDATGIQPRVERVVTWLADKIERALTWLAE